MTIKAVQIRDRTRDEDLRDLEILYLIDVVGLSRTKAAPRVGVKPTLIAPLIRRIRDAAVPCACTKPENRDGGMPERWWA